MCPGTAKHGVLAGTGRLDAWNIAQALEQPEQCDPLLLRIRLVDRLDADQEHVRHGEAGVDARHSDEGEDEQTTDEEHDQAEAHLDGDERTHHAGADT